MLLHSLRDTGPGITRKPDPDIVLDARTELACHSLQQPQLRGETPASAAKQQVHAQLQQLPQRQAQLAGL